MIHFLFWILGVPVLMILVGMLWLMAIGGLVHLVVG